MTALESPCGAAGVSLEDKVRFLADPRTHGAPVTALETHMSWVFLAGDRAYKLKKPVRFAYLDFSTLSRRERTCRTELRLNRRLARDVYLAVVPLVRRPRGLSIGGEGEVVDWLVEMRRLDAERMLPARLANHLETAELDRIAGALVRFYRRAGRAKLSPAAYKQILEAARRENRRVLLDKRFALPRGRVRAIDGVLERFLRRNGHVLADRVRRGRIVDGHGDLRPEHVCISDPVRIIDCLEFSAALRAGDWLDEISLLDLECERLGAPSAGRRLRSKILAGLGESDRGALYSFYRCHKAMLRARLSVAHLLEPSPRSPGKWLPLTKAYLAVAAADAARVARQLRRPGGPSASGCGAAAAAPRR